MISDGEDVSTAELLQKMARAFGKRSFLLPVPVGLMTFVDGLLGKRDVADRLFGSLHVDSSKARDLLGWSRLFLWMRNLRRPQSGIQKSWRADKLIYRQCWVYKLSHKSS